MNESNDLRERVSDLEDRITEIEDTMSDGVSLDKEVSLPELLNNKSSAGTHKEKIVVIAYYLEAYEDKDAYTTSAFKRGYSKCGFGDTNWSARASEAVSSGYLRILDDSKPRKYSLTNTGVSKAEGLIESDS